MVDFGSEGNERLDRKRREEKDNSLTRRRRRMG